MPEIVDVLLRGAGQILTCRCTGKGPKRGSALAEPGVIAGGAIAVREGRILAIGTGEKVARSIEGAEVRLELDAGGRVVLPGWVDPHTHAVFSHYRPDEYEARIMGESYLEIGRKGGGIKRTVREVRAMDEDRLFELGRRRLLKMLEQGTTTVEIKSGYGLDLENELKILRVVRRLAAETPLDIVPTFLGAHEKPPECSSEQYLSLVIDGMIPAVTDRGLARYIDVFCEEGVFDLEETGRVLEAGKSAGLGLKIHADEINALGGTELAVDLGAVSAEHLVKVTRRGIEKLAGSDTMAVLLPGTTFALGHSQFAPARELIEAGAGVALATDFNPGSAPSWSVQLVLAIACSQMRLTPAEAVNAATINAAHAVGMEREVGSLEIGKKADMVVYDVEDYREIPSRAGVNHADTVVKAGKIVWRRHEGGKLSEVGL